MRKINMESPKYDKIVDAITVTVSGFSGTLVNALFRHTFVGQTFFEKQVVRFGSLGLGGATAAGVAPKVRDIIDSFAELYNILVDTVNEVKAARQKAE